MAEIRTFIESVCTRAGVGRQDCLKVMLIVEELFTNTVTHGYHGESGSPVWIGLDPNESGLILRYEDAAPPHNPFAEFRPMDTAVLLEQQPVGGLGLKLIRNLATDAAYSREGERNCIRLSFAIRPRDGRAC